jgi:hypothetical protein
MLDQLHLPDDSDVKERMLEQLLKFASEIKSQKRVDDTLGASRWSAGESVMTKVGYEQHRAQHFGTPVCFEPSTCPGRTDECWNCGKSNQITTLQQCSRCKVAKYCGKQCQKEDWKSGHKNDCQQ